MRDRLRRAASGITQRGETIGLGGKGVGESDIVHLEKNASPFEAGAEAAVDAAAAHRPHVGDAEMLQPDVRRVLARFRRSTRMPMKARSNLLRQETLACSRSATRICRMRESAPAATVAPRVWPLSERYAISPKHSPAPSTVSSFLFLLTRISPS